MSSSWGVLEWLGVLGAIFTALSAFASGVWWMSAMYSKVKDIRNYMAEWRVEDKEEKKLIWAKLHEIRKTVASHGQRIVALEKTP